VFCQRDMSKVLKLKFTVRSLVFMNIHELRGHEYIQDNNDIKCKVQVGVLRLLVFMHESNIL